MTPRLRKVFEDPSHPLWRRLLWILFLFLLIVGFLVAWRVSNDLSIYWRKAWIPAWKGDWYSIYDPSLRVQGGYYYSPFFAVSLAWLGALPWVLVKVGYFVMNLGIIALCVLGMRRFFKQVLNITPSAQGSFLVLLGMGNQWLGQCNSGNVSLLISGLSLFAIVAGFQGAWLASAVGLALATNIKVYPGFVALYLGIFRRDVKFLAAFALSLAFFFLVPSLVVGLKTNWELHQLQWQVLIALAPQEDFAREALQSLPSTLVRVGRHFNPFALSRDAWDTRTAQLGQVLVVLVGLLFWTQPRGGRTLREEVERGPGVGTRREAMIAFAILALAGQFSLASWVNHAGFVYAPLLWLVLELGFQDADPLDPVSSSARTWGLVGFFAFYVFTVSGIVGRTLNDTLELWSIPTLGIWCLLYAAKRMEHEMAGKVVRDRARAG